MNQEETIKYLKFRREGWRGKNVYIFKNLTKRINALQDKFDKDLERKKKEQKEWAKTLEQPTKPVAFIPTLFVEKPNRLSVKNIFKKKSKK